MMHGPGELKLDREYILQLGNIHDFIKVQEFHNSFELLAAQ